jgi:protein-S-isoprenylcysteine O-methyltransferase Ste14
MNTEALILYAIFGLVAFGWRTWLQWRRTGDTGLRMHAKFGTMQWWAKLAFIAAILCGVAAPIAGLLGLDPIAALDNNTAHLIGVVLAVLGIAGTALAQWQMGESWRIGVDESEHTGLVTNGIFGVVRNPIFTAMLITALGLTLMVGNVVAVAGLVALVLALQLQVRTVEEPYLLRTHPDSYGRYASAAGRFLPGVGRLAPRP